MHRSILFVTGDRPDRIDKALSKPADLICIDLEDGVALADKEIARENIRRASERLKGNNRVLYRINHPSTKLGHQDLKVLRGRNIAGIIVPKVESTDDIKVVRQTLDTKLMIFAIIESPLGMARIFDIAAAKDLTALLFGTGDWSKETGSDMSWDSLLYGRSLIIHAAALTGIVPLDGAFLNVKDQAALQEETTKLRRMGFRGRIALHPDQVETINACFAPSDEEVKKAQRIIEGFDNANGRTITVDGVMVDQPIYEAAKKMVALANK